ncbi:unnamed protein product [Prunus armeniaca]|nr:hypothetical protein GBA52_020678 [Prunus armeniaca]
MSKEDKLFNFLKNLQPWAHSELKRQDVKYLNFAIATAERLMDYRAAVISSGKKTQGRGAEGLSKSRCCSLIKYFRLEGNRKN